MKRVLLQTVLFACFSLLCDMAYGQTGILYRVPMQGTDNIVRYEPTTGKHVTYLLVSGVENHFSLTDMNTLIDVRVAIGLNVKDFEIIDGMVFFCGENGGGSGFLGWFDIDSLFHLAGRAHIDQTLLTLGLQTLDNIEVFRNPSTGNVHIAGYGLHSDEGSNLRLYRAFEAIGTLASGMAYRTLDLWSSGVYGDVSDVDVTDNLVVYLSSSRNQACDDHVGIGIYLQPFPKYDMFGTPPFYYHFFQLSYMSPSYSYCCVVPINNDPYNDLYNNVHPRMVHSTGDEVAVCTHRTDLNDVSPYFYPGPYGLCARMLAKAAYITHMRFDLSALVPSTNNYIQMASYVVAKLPDTLVYSIDGFEYDPQTHRYAILHRHVPLSGVAEHAVTTVNFISGGTPAYFESSYQTFHNTSSGWMPKSICLDGSLQYTVMGYDMVSSEYIMWHNSFVPYAGGCDNIVQYPTSEIPLVPAKYYENEVKSTSWMPLLFVEQESLPFGEAPCIQMCN